MIFSRKTLFFLCFSAYALGAEKEAQPCLSWENLLKNDNPESIISHLNSKRPYPDSKNTITLPQNCSIVHTIYLGRHASRYVTKIKVLTEIEKALKERLESGSAESDLTGTGRILQEQVARLIQSVDETQAAGNITRRGQRELELIARRLATGIKLAPAQIEAEGAIVAMTSSKIRTSQSLNALMQGLKDWSFNQSLSYSSGGINGSINEYSDQILRSYDFCPNRKGAYQRSKDQLENERERLIKESKLSFNFTQLLSNKVLGFEERVEVAEYLYNLCQIDSSFVDEEKYGFCRYLLDKDGNASNEAKLIGLLVNNKEWYKRGFGSGKAVMYNLSYPLLERVINELSRINSSNKHSSNKHSSNKHHPMLNLWFGHDSTIIAMLMLVGYYGDQPDYRYWDADLASPMSSNIQWRVYLCDGEYKLHVLLNEQPVCNSDCPEAFCSLSGYIEILREKQRQIDYSAECGITPGK